MIISVDTGNKMIKTETLEFNAGVEVYDQIPGEQEDVIFYEGQYYRTSSKRLSYLEDKTEDDRYFILTLFAVVKELQEKKKQENLITNGLIEIELLVGLPPAHYGRQRRSFREYFYRDGGIIDFCYMNQPYKIAFTDVQVYIQAYAAYCLVAAKRQLFTYPLFICRQRQRLSGLCYLRAAGTSHASTESHTFFCRMVSKRKGGICFTEKCNDDLQQTSFVLFLKREARI